MNDDQLGLWDTPPHAPPGRLEAGIERSDLAASYRWTPLEQMQVDNAIETIAASTEYFTADAVWDELGPDFPVTKGLAGRLMAAVGRGTIVGSGKVTFSQRKGVHGHGQRLAVWRSMVVE